MEKCKDCVIGHLSDTEDDPDQRYIPMRSHPIIKVIRESSELWVDQNDMFNFCPDCGHKIVKV